MSAYASNFLIHHGGGDAGNESTMLVYVMDVLQPSSPYLKHKHPLHHTVIMNEAQKHKIKWNRNRQPGRPSLTIKAQPNHCFCYIKNNKQSLR